jgi:hypothetical protein
MNRIGGGLYLEEFDAAVGCAEVLLEREDVVLEAVALLLGGEELEAEGAVGDGEAQGAVDGVAHVLLGAAGERRSPAGILRHLRRWRRRGRSGSHHRSGPVTAAVRLICPRARGGGGGGDGEFEIESKRIENSR